MKMLTGVVMVAIFAVPVISGWGMMINEISDILAIMSDARLALGG